ncbi:MAG: transaldolase [Chloroflexota bacterium]|nr:transaldolase [Chloroflexota bacterium]
MMQILLDSAIINEARQAAAWGWVSGATTNPSLLAKSSLPPAETLAELGGLLSGPIFYQLTGKSLQAMQSEASQAYEILGEQLVLKIPATDLGFQASASLSPQYPVAMTSVFSPAQAMLAAAAGARYALYYHNRAKRLLPEGQGEHLAEELVHALAGTDTQVAAASLKSPQEMVEARMAGVPILSAPLAVLAQMPQHTLSEQAVADFDANGSGLLD